MPTRTTKQGPAFSADQFVATPYTSAEEKAKAANRLARFIERGFPEMAWNQPLYRSLYLHLFGHIAHYSSTGFWAEWFASPGARLRWLEYASSYPLYGSPEHTWVDVEAALQGWFRQNGVLEHYRQRVAAGE